jgi:N4-(beta-N-acetylglucosaminyl)-L-asparaginase
MSKLHRRDFVKAGTVAGFAAAAPWHAATAQTGGQPASPAVAARGSFRAVVVASANGHHYKNGGDKTCVETAYERIVRGEDVLDALVAGVNIVENDPEDTSVGYGGLPNADGVVQLDASVMHGPTKRAGAVACIEGVREPSRVAKKVMEETDHHLVVGKDAQRFARVMGFKIEDDLNTERSRKAWIEWKRRTDPLHYLEPIKKQAALREVEAAMMADGWVDPHHFYGTINCNGVNSRGDVCGVTTTSGLAWKIPGRVGDSPILGAGLYVDGEVGAAGSTGRGEANLYSLASFLIVEGMRRGLHPKDAGMEALKRIKANTVPRLMNKRGEPSFNINFYILNRKGEYAGVAMYSNERNRARFSVCDDKGARIEQSEPLLTGSATD